jgi:hypothetical protein
MVKALCDVHGIEVSSISSSNRETQTGPSGLISPQITSDVSLDVDMKGDLKDV